MPRSRRKARSKGPLVYILTIGSIGSITMIAGLVILLVLLSSSTESSPVPSSASASTTYEPNWESLDARPLPDWYDEGKFGIFCHWGVYSVPSVLSEWFWWHWKGDNPPYQSAIDYMKQNFKPGFSYADFGPMFTAELFDPYRFADIVRQSGAKYFVLTSKHHEGYTMYPSNYSWNWNSMDVGPHRDLVGDLRAGFLKNASDVHFGLYFSQLEWFNRLYQNDIKTNFTTNTYATEVSYPQMLEIVNSYKPDVVWSDGDWDTGPEYWKSKEFLAWLYNDSPVKDTVVVNDRWGVGTMGAHGGYFTYADHFDPGHIVPRKWENCMTLDGDSWGFRRTMALDDIHEVADLITQLARTISCGGNLLLNFGPTHDGRIIPIFEERLRAIGRWLDTNGEAVYGTKPWIYQNDSNVWYTSAVRSSDRLHPARVFNAQDEQNTIVYAFVLDWPQDGVLVLPSVKATDKTRAQMLGYTNTLPIKAFQGGARIDLSGINWRTLPSFDAWVIRLEFIKSEQRDPVKEAINKGLLSSDGHPTVALRQYAQRARQAERTDQSDRGL